MNIRRRIVLGIVLFVVVVGGGLAGAFGRLREPETEPQAPSSVSEEPNPLDEVEYRERRSRSPDTDGDGVLDIDDNCGLVPNRSQADNEQDGRGDACE